MLKLFAGFDPREEVGYHVFCSSVIHNCSEPVAITPLHLDMFRNFYTANQRDGTNAFIYTRFLIPYLQCYKGWALFMDGADMVVLGDLAKLWDMRDESKAVQVVKHNYKTKHPRKYIGTAMCAHNEDYPRKNWSSVMLINCAHPDWRNLMPETVSSWPGSKCHRFEFLDDGDIGSLPKSWNWLADEYGPSDKANVLHWTAGIPAWPAYRDAPMADKWRDAYSLVNHASA